MQKRLTPVHSPARMMRSGFSVSNKMAKPFADFAEHVVFGQFHVVEEQLPLGFRDGKPTGIRVPTIPFFFMSTMKIVKPSVFS